MEFIFFLVIAAIILGLFKLMYSSVAPILYLLFDKFHLLFFQKKFLPHYPWNKRRLPVASQQILSEHIEFYRQLPESKKKVFEHRLQIFLRRKKFLGRKGLEVTPKMRLIIGAVAIKLTFGLRNYKLPLVQAILLYPDVYKSRATGKMHQGEFHPTRRYIALSWKHVKSGVLDNNDNFSLALHEFSHALFKEFHFLQRPDPVFANNYSKLLRKLKKGKNFKLIAAHPYFRDYAQTNIMEFLAVATEHFHESPQQFKKELPPIYKMFCNIFNIDPLKL